MKQLLAILIIGVLFWGSENGHAANTVLTPFPITLTLVSEPHDEHGTDVSNIYTLEVNFAQSIYANNNAYTLMYFVDGIPLEEFKSQALPFSLKRNYKGLMEGDHSIKIDVEDGRGNVLATGATMVHVAHNKNNEAI